MPGISVAPNEAVFEYSNEQPAAMLWYHDHAMGITRLNAYAGLAALYFIRDAQDTGLPGNPLGLPAGPYEIPLVLQDKTLNPDGSLFYPTVGITAVHPVWMPEFFGDTPIINGTAYPFHLTEPRRYRFRMVNGSQARFYNLSFNNGLGQIPFHLIGMEQSLAPAPVPLTRLLLSPGERADVIVDFSAYANQTITLKNDAKAPYPGGRGGDVVQLVQFRVTKPLVGSDTTTPAAALVLPPVPRLVATPTAPVREIVMKEEVDPLTGNPIDMKLNGKWFDEAGVPIDETPRLNDNETWQFINLTVDAHPMHLHLVKFQVVDRQPFKALAYGAAWTAWITAGSNPATKPVLANFLSGAAVPPLREEMGWKDTAKSYPGEILRVIAKFELPPGAVAPAEYVYHCHILEHEENEMMRPFLVTAAGLGKESADRNTSSAAPKEFALDQNYPNPFNPQTTIRFHLPQDGHVKLNVFNSVGQEVAVVADGNFAAGSHAVKFNALNLPSGAYTYRIESAGLSMLKKMILLK
jgi:spore coat protein A